MDGPRRSAAVAALLPDDAIVEILSRVPARSLCRFKCVSKAWRDLIADRFRCKKLPQTLEGFFYAYDDDDNKMRGCSSSDDGGSKGNGGGASSDRVAHGHFINTLGRPVPLASYSFLLEQPGIEAIGLMRSCNGLLLFGHRRDSDTYESLGYIVCNPVTEQWVAVPSSGWEPLYPSDESEDSDSETGYNCPPFTYLIFDPAVSSHFHLVQFWTYDDVFVEEVHTCLKLGYGLSVQVSGVQMRAYHSSQEAPLFMACCISVSPALAGKGRTVTMSKLLQLMGKGRSVGSSACRRSLVMWFLLVNPKDSCIT